MLEFPTLLNITRIAHLILVWGLFLQPFSFQCLVVVSVQLFGTVAKVKQPHIHLTDSPHTVLAGCNSLNCK